MIDLTLDKKRILPFVERAARAASATGGHTKMIRLSPSAVQATGLEYDFTGTFGDTDGEAICLSGKEFAERLALMPDGLVRIKSDATYGVKLSASGVKRAYSLRGAPAQDFPMLGKPRDAWHTLPTETLRSLIARVAYAAGQDPSRPQTCGVFFEWQGTDVIMAATDGHRLAVARDTVTDPWHAALFLPVGAMRALSEKNDGDASVDEDGFFRFGAVTYRVNLVQSRFPPYERVIPKTFANTVEIAREPLMAGIKAVAPANPDFITFTFDGDGLTLRAESKDGDAVDGVDVTYAGEPVTLALKPSYVIDALASVDDEHVKMGLNGPLDPVTFAAPGWQSIVMPLSGK